ncbi:MAG: hypothetical protein VXZ99_11185, partial [Pseudomonadota bacterium]|nr:hypothetical protein [Pseudomonadota bacterium]
MPSLHLRDQIVFEAFTAGVSKRVAHQDAAICRQPDGTAVGACRQDSELAAAKDMFLLVFGQLPGECAKGGNGYN